MLPYGRQSIDETDIEAVVKVLRSDWLTQGPAVEQFEHALAARCNARHAVVVSNGTAALHLACMALGLKPGDWLWTSPITFAASANCALYCGARVDFVDIHPRTYNLDPDRLAEKLAVAEKEGRLPKVVVAVHLAGQSCDMKAISALAKRYGFYIIEDACHAIGGSYEGQPIGDGRYSDAVVFSFHPVKIITTGEGGAILTNNADLNAKLALLRTHGITRDPKLMTEPSHGPWYYQQLELGYNYRMTDLQAALGLSQLQRMEEFVRRRVLLAHRYDELLRELPVQTPFQHPDTASAWHLYVVRLRLDELKKSHRQVFEALRAAGIGVNLHYIPVYAHPCYRQMGFDPGHFPQAERYYAEAISLPIFFGLAEADQDRVVSALKAAVLP